METIFICRLFTQFVLIPPREIYSLLNSTCAQSELGPTASITCLFENVHFKSTRDTLLPPWRTLPQLSWHCASLQPGLCFSRRCVRTPSPPGSPHGSGRMRGNAGASEAAGIRSQLNVITHSWPRPDYTNAKEPDWTKNNKWVNCFQELEGSELEYATLPSPCRRQPNVGPWTWQSAQRRTRKTETKRGQREVSLVPVFIC